MKDEERIQKVNTDRIEGEYILKDTDADKKKIVFSTVIWYDPETGKYYFKSESDMGGDTLAGQIVSHKLIQDLLSISKWILKSDGMIMRTYAYEDLTDIFMSLKCPIYLVYGLMSQIFSQEILEYTTYVGNLAEESVVGIPGAMHHLFIDEPIIFVEEVKKLLKK